MTKDSQTVTRAFPDIDTGGPVRVFFAEDDETLTDWIMAIGGHPGDVYIVPKNPEDATGFTNNPSAHLIGDMPAWLHEVIQSWATDIATYRPINRYVK